MYMYILIHTHTHTHTQVNFTFNVEEVTEQIKTEEFAKKQREKKEIFEKKIKAMQKPGAWKIAGSAVFVLLY